MFCTHSLRGELAVDAMTWMYGVPPGLRNAGLSKLEELGISFQETAMCERGLSAGCCVDH